MPPARIPFIIGADARIPCISIAPARIHSIFGAPWKITIKVNTVGAPKNLSIEGGNTSGKSINLSTPDI